MAGLDYFLDSKWIKKTRESIETNLYITNIPSTITSRFNFNFENQIKQDRYLYDYINAYKIDADSKTVKDMQLLEILTILTLDGDLDENDPKILRVKIVEILNGRKPENKDERKIWNILEVINLINEEKFFIDENNFELFIHIIFRNIGYDLDSKKTYYRDSKTKSQFKNLVNISMIDTELNSLIYHIKKLGNTDISGFTQIFLIMIDFIFISPYKQFNILIAYLLSKWFILRLDSTFLYEVSIHHLAINWSEFVGSINEAFTSNFNLDKSLSLLKEMVKAKVNFAYRLNILNNWEIEYKSTFTDVIDKLVVINTLGYNTIDWKIEKIKSDFVLKNKVLLDENEIENMLERLVNMGIYSYQQKGPLLKFSFADGKLEKARMILKD